MVRIISIHALREEGDVPASSSLIAYTYFYPRPPRGGRPGGLRGAGHRLADFYPRPPRGGRLVDMEILGLPLEISIHALREEGDAIRPRSS